MLWDNPYIEPQPEKKMKIYTVVAEEKNLGYKITLNNVRASSTTHAHCNFVLMMNYDNGNCWDVLYIREQAEIL
jgi:hypothetical protein